jgi:hypothetical protein
MHFRTIAHGASRPLVVGLALFAAACATDSGPAGPSNDDASFARGGQQGPDLRAASAAKERHADRLLRQDGIEGVGVSLAADGKPAVMVFTRHGAVGRIPARLDGIPVTVEVTGRIEAILPQAKPGGGGGGGNPTSRARPVPIGYSIGNAGECSAGTLGARVVSGGIEYVLSNNHVLALENDAAIGSTILQPGRYDTNCASNPGDAIATLSRFEPIQFGGANNTVDAAIARITTPGSVLNSTSGGYGVPGSTPVNAAVNMAVQKCGRTTGCTRGRVTAVNATINVSYTGGVARFVNQVVITATRGGSFSKSGDSGSLIVTDNSAASPVALLFAGSAKTTIGNPISVVLQRMGVSIDGK